MLLDIGARSEQAKRVSLCLSHTHTLSLSLSLSVVLECYQVSKYTQFSYNSAAIDQLYGDQVSLTNPITIIQHHLNTCMYIARSSSNYVSTTICMYQEHTQLSQKMCVHIFKSPVFFKVEALSSQTIPG